MITISFYCDRNYLELMVELPWSKSSKDSLDLTQARLVTVNFKRSYFRQITFSRPIQSGP